NFEAMTEPVFTFLATAALVLWVRHVWSQPGSAYGWKHAALIGLLAGPAAPARPPGRYLAPVLPPPPRLVAGRRRDWRLFGRAGVLVVSAAVLIVPWIVRNYAVSGIARLTISDTVGLVYNAAAGAYQVELGISREEAQDRIRDEYGLVAHDLTLNYWLVDQPIAEIDAA